MARVTEFEPDQALDRAVEVFWEKGFSDASMEDLINSMGVARYGVYNNWGNKRELYLAALKKYINQRLGILHRFLGKPGASLAEIKQFFELVLSQPPGDQPGCFACNAAIELAPHDTDVADLIRNMFAEAAREFRKALGNAQQKGELSTDYELDDLAEYLANTIRSAALMHRSGYSGEYIKRHVKIALGVLG
jgi:TetR/AcrR family transcriptional repressor of nem operon